MDDTIPQPRPRLTDEAAAQVLDFLYEFIADFESAYAAQIKQTAKFKLIDPNVEPMPQTKGTLTIIIRYQHLGCACIGDGEGSHI